MKNLIYLLFALTFVGCVSQSDYDKLNAEKESLQSRVNELEDELSKMKQYYEVLQAEKGTEGQENQEKVKSKQLLENQGEGKNEYTEADALEYVKDYYDFYNRNKIYANPEIRRVDGNTFQISLDETFREFADDKDMWYSTVITLTVEDGKYSIE